MVAPPIPARPAPRSWKTSPTYPNVYAEWATNEKVSLDVAIGAAYAGRRGLPTMKHVGLNVAADALMYAAMTGIEAGLVIVSADDPGMHSSQNEQDNRTFAKFARIPCLEPSDSQEAKDLTVAAFELERALRYAGAAAHDHPHLPLHQRGGAGRASQKPLPSASAKKFPRNPAKYVMVPGNAIKRHPLTEQRIHDLAAFAETFPFNRIEPGRPRAGDHHRRRGLPVRQRSLPRRVGPAPGNDLAAARKTHPPVCRLCGAPDRRSKSSTRSSKRACA